MTLTASDTEFALAWQTWHDDHEAARADRHGFLAITSVRWLDSAPTAFDDVPGRWSTTARDGVVVELAAGEELVVDGHAVTGRYEFGRIPERAGVTAAFGDDAVVEVARRGGYDIVRPRHPDAEVRQRYGRTPAFAADPKWQVRATFRPYDRPREVTVGAVVDGVQHVYAAPGELVFTLDGLEYSLVAFDGRTPGSFTVLFTDATSGVTTYAANRSLAVPAPDADGRTVLDFNRATNLPCAYTPFATCPLPPAENRLDAAVEAGERFPFLTRAETASRATPAG